MVSHLVCYDVGVCEIPARAYRRLHLFEKVKVDVYGLVGRAVERPDLGGGVAASRLHSSCEHHKFGTPVFTPALAAELRGPDILCTGQHFGCQVGEPFILCVGLVGGLGGLAAGPLADDIANHIAYVATAQEGDDSGDDYPHDSSADTNGASG